MMHPEKYFAQEDAQTVEAPSITGDWNKTKNDRFGEYFILVMLDDWISETEAEQATEGSGAELSSTTTKEMTISSSRGILLGTRGPMPMSFT